MRKNDRYQQYYDALQLVSGEQREEFWAAFQRDLPNSFRFTGSRAHALAVQDKLRNKYIPEITSITHEGSYVDAPLPVQWYPDQLAWYMTTPKNIIRRFPPFASFQKFLVAENDVGSISRQEVVSMIPPLLMGLRPEHTILDLCAAPGSKSAQLIELLQAGEEDRCRSVAEAFAAGAEMPSGIEYSDDGRSTGLLIANDVDYKRAHMLVHQLKRLSSPNLLVTNHDATVFPSIKLPSEPSVDGKKMPNRYLKFDRILADVPCSGDGTSRKNLEIWRTWTPGNGLGQHLTQVRILVRALQMLKVGGRVVYSTCSMNPVEDEAVLAAAIERCGGSDLVDIIETKDSLPGLKRYPGLKEWKVMDKAGRIWNTFEEVEEHRIKYGEDGLGRLSRSMFPPANLPLDRAIRVYPFSQDTGAFFIAILEKKSEIKARPEGHAITTKPATNGTNGQPPCKSEAEAPIGVEVPASASRELSPASLKRKREEEATLDVDDVKKPKPDEVVTATSRLPDAMDMDNKSTGDNLESSQSVLLETDVKPSLKSKPAADEDANTPTTTSTPNPTSNTFKTRNKQPFEEPFNYLPSDLSDIQHITRFYTLSPQFPLDRFMVRNADGKATKNIYYTTKLTRDILSENEGKGMKFVHAGIKMFVKQDVPREEVCPWRIQTDGLPLLEAWVGPERVIKLSKRKTLRKLLVEMFPQFEGNAMEELGEIGPQILEVGFGCCVLRVEPSDAEDGLKERMVFPLWKSLHSLNLMLPKEDRKAMLLRLFDDDTPLVNTTLKQEKAKKEQKVELKVEESADMEDTVTLGRRNSSSAESDVAMKKEDVMKMEDDAPAPNSSSAGADIVTKLENIVNGIEQQLDEIKEDLQGPAEDGSMKIEPAP